MSEDVQASAVLTGGGTVRTEVRSTGLKLNWCPRGDSLHTHTPTLVTRLLATCCLRPAAACGRRVEAETKVGSWSYVSHPGTFGSRCSSLAQCSVHGPEQLDEVPSSDEELAGWYLVEEAVDGDRGWRRCR
jgi:hypothetical protein